MNIPKAATLWARKLNCPPDSLKRLKGGINNNVYKCDNGNESWVIKNYPRKENSNRTNKMRAEIELLQLAEIVSPNQVAKLINVDYDNNCVVLEYIQGAPLLSRRQPTCQDIKEAGIFYNLLNSDQKLANKIITLRAADAFPSLNEHVSNINKRITKMSYGHLSIHQKKSAKIILTKLKYYSFIAENLVKNYSNVTSLNQYIESNDFRVSPSDFGFHNAVETSGGIKFIDFEFAGWDDPTKTVADFLIQPSFKIRQQDTEFTIKALFPHQDNKFRKRLNIMIPIIRLKWACIMLSVLNEDRLKDFMRINPALNTEELISERIRNSKRVIKPLEYQLKG